MVCMITYANMLMYILSFETGVPHIFYIQGSVWILDKPVEICPQRSDPDLACIFFMLKLTKLWLNMFLLQNACKTGLGPGSKLE